MLKMQHLQHGLTDSLKANAGPIGPGSENRFLPIDEI
jgi:hypothetical protein